MSINKVILIGNACQDPDVRSLDGGIKVAYFSLATNERGYTLANGTQVPERVEYHNIVVWRGLAELAEKWVVKGQQLYIEGKITTKTWEKDGVKHYKTEILSDTMQLIGVWKKDQSSQQYSAGPATYEQPGSENDLPY